MENNKKTFTITITEDDKYLYAYIKEALCTIDDEETNAIKSILEGDIKSLNNIRGNGDFDSSKSFPSPATLKDILKNKDKEELVSLRELFKNDILNYSSLFNQNITLNGISFYDKHPESWYVADRNPVAHIILYSNYIEAIDSLLNKKEENNLDSLLNAICVPEKNKASITKKKFNNFIKSNLTDIEARIIIARYGLGNEKAKSLLDLSKQFSITREKIRQMIEKSILKLRAVALEQAIEEEIYNIK